MWLLEKTSRSFPLCLKGLMPDDFRMGMLLAKAEPIRYWKCLEDDIVMKHTTSSSQNRGVRIFKRNRPAEPRTVKEGKEVLQVSELRFLCSICLTIMKLIFSPSWVCPAHSNW